MKTFECFTCKDNSDNPEDYTYPISELANPEQEEEFWMCKECDLCERDDLEDYEIWDDYEEENDYFE